MSEPQEPQPVREAPLAVRRWQLSIGELLLVTLGLAVLLGAWRVFRGRPGPVELGLLVPSAVSILLAGLFPRPRIPWAIGLGVCMLPGLLATVVAWAAFGLPGVLASPAATAIVIGLYGLAGGPILLAVRRGGRPWPWMLGSLACLAFAVLVTPPDPLSMLVIAMPALAALTMFSFGWSEGGRPLLISAILLLAVGPIIDGSKWWPVLPDEARRALKWILPDNCPIGVPWIWEGPAYFVGRLVCVLGAIGVAAGAWQMRLASAPPRDGKPDAPGDAEKE